MGLFIVVCDGGGGGVVGAVGSTAGSDGGDGVVVRGVDAAGDVAGCCWNRRRVSGGAFGECVLELRVDVCDCKQASKASGDDC